MFEALATAAIYGAAVLWTIGVIGIFIHLFFDDMMCDRFLVVFIGGPVAIAAIIVPWGGIAYMNSPDLAVLKKAEWQCSETRIENTTTVAMSADGKTSTVVPTVQSVCVEYRQR